MARSAQVSTNYVIFTYLILLRWIYVETSSYCVILPTIHNIWNFFLNSSKYGLSPSLELQHVELY